MKTFITCFTLLLFAGPLCAAEPELSWPPKIPGGSGGGKVLVTDTSPQFLTSGVALKPGVKIATTPPTVDFMYYSGQDYPAKLWSAWGESLAVGDKCYSSIGDHTAPMGNAFLYEYDSKTKTLTEVVDTRAVLKLPDGHYTPGKFHSRIDLGSDGWLYFSTHRGSTRTTTAANHFTGGWIMRYHRQKKKTEIVAHAPLPMQTMPTSRLDPKRMIFYAGTADGDYKTKRVMFLAYDVKNRKKLYSDDFGPKRYMIFAPSTGKAYWHAKQPDSNNTDLPGQLVRFDPDKPSKPTPIDARLGLRAASEESAAGIVYTVDGDKLWAFNTKTEKATYLGPSAVGENTYTTSIDLDSKTQRYLYYIPGAHGGAHRDGSPLVQYDIKTNTRKVIAFLSTFYHQKYGFIPCGSYGSAVSPQGDKVYITWNGNRNTPAGKIGRKVKFDICAFMVVHIPESERKQ